MIRKILGHIVYGAAYTVGYITTVIKSIFRR